MTELRSGYTTGTCAAAAAKAALLFLRTEEIPLEVDVPLPAGGRLVVPVLECIIENNGVRGVVRKDGGDDPDATHGARIESFVRFEPGDEAPRCTLDGGTGVGRVTLPGLEVQVGEAAINPAPRWQIKAAALEAATGMRGILHILVEVPEGEHIAKKTMNSRLGILGGISILGTHGIVRPFSHDAWAASIESALDIAGAAGVNEPVFTTGRRSERFYMERFPDSSRLALVQAADFFAHSCRATKVRGFHGLGWSVFFGKLVKQSQGFEYTHAKDARIDFQSLADVCAAFLPDTSLLPRIKTANTAREVLGMLGTGQTRSLIVEALVKLATDHIHTFAPGLEARYVVFDFDGTLLYR